MIEQPSKDQKDASQLYPYDYAYYDYYNPEYDFNERDNYLVKYEKRPSIFDTLGIDPAILQQLSSKPYNSILKKSSSYSINPSDTALRQPYRSVTAAEQPSWKSALENLQNLFKRSEQR